MSAIDLRRYASIVLATVFFLGWRPQAGPQARQPEEDPQLAATTFFVENVGQFAEGARFQMRGAAGDTLWLADDALWLTYAPRTADPAAGRGVWEVDHAAGGRMGRVSIANAGRSTGALAPNRGTGVNLRLSFAGASLHPRLVPYARQATAVNYYLGNDPARWRAGVPAWRGVRYVDVYPGVDLEVWAEGAGWNWRLACRADCRLDLPDVRLRIEGAEEVVPGDGALRLGTAAGDVDIPLPAVEGTLPDARPIASQVGRGTFEVSTPFAPADRGLQPTACSQDDWSNLLLGTFLGGAQGDAALDIAVAGNGSLYVTGETSSTDFPTTPGAYDDSLTGRTDAFVARLTAAGDALVFSTFLGGDRADHDYAEQQGLSVVVGPENTANVLGWTRSDSFPTTPGALDPDYNPYVLDPEREPFTIDLFVTRLGASGTLLYSTYLGYACDTLGGIAVNTQGHIYVAGDTGFMTITGDPIDPIPTTPGAYDRTFNDYNDTFVVVIDPAGQGADDLVYGTYVGGGAYNFATGMVLGSDGTVYVTGRSHGGLPTTPGAYDRSPDGVGSDAFFYRLDPAGNGSADLLYATYLGGDRGEETGWGIALHNGHVYLTGDTWASDFPATPGAYDTTFNSNSGVGADGFVSIVNPAAGSASDLLYSTYLGGIWHDQGTAVDVDASGDVYVAGRAFSPDFPTTPGALPARAPTNPFIPSAFVVRLQPQANGTDDLGYSTWLGGQEGDGDDAGYGLAIGADTSVYVAGYTQSTDFRTTPGAYDTAHNGGDDAFIVQVRAVPRYDITGRVTGGAGQALLAVQLSAGGSYVGATGTDGTYTLSNLPGGDYVLRPITPGYFWSPEARSVSVPPGADGQDFVGRNIDKQCTVSSQQIVDYADLLTYTVRVVYPGSRSVVFYDPVPTYTTFVSGSLVAPPGVTYDPVEGVVAGPLDLAAGVPATVTFAVRVAVTGTLDFSPRIANRACVHPPAGGLAGCEWSNEVSHLTYARLVYLPLVTRGAGP